MGWAFLPPVQRTLATPISTVTRPTEFPHQLPAWRDPSFTEPLTHLVTDSAPSGVISADDAPVGTPTSSATPRPEMTLLPPPPPKGVQRSVQRQITPLTGAARADLPVVHRAVVDDPAPVREPDPAPEPDPVTPEAPTLAETADLPVGPAATPRSTTVSEAESRPILRYDAAPPTLPLQRAAEPGSPAQPSRHRPGLGEPLTALPPSAVPEPPPLVLRSAVDSAPTSSPAAPSGPSAPPATTSEPAAAEPSESAPASVEETPAPPAAESAPEPTASEPTDSADSGPGQPVQRLADSAPLGAAAQPLPLVTQPLAETGGAATAESPAVVAPAASWTSTPLPLATPVATSIQRSSVLSGPGVPQRSLTVRPTPLFPAPPGPRAVPVQRVPAGVPLNPAPPRPAAAAAVQRSAATGPDHPAGIAGPTARGASDADRRGHGDLPLADSGGHDVPPADVTGPVLSRAVDSTEIAGTPATPTPTASAPITVEPPKRTFVQRLFGLPSPPRIPQLPSAPSMPSLPALPSAPAMPSMPSMPDLPAMPGRPTMPDLPGVPSMSDLPAMPEMPSMPELPSVPDVPALSDLPGMPSMPELPVVPDLPTGPGASGLPLPSLPSIPSMPGLPGASALPGALPTPPGMPSMPTLPSMPSLPSMPLAVPSMPSLPSVPDPAAALGSLPGLAGVAGAAAGALPGGLPGLPGLGGPAEVPRDATEVAVPGAGGGAPGGSAAPAAGGAAGAGSAGADASTPEQIEALAGKLLNPMLRRIKSELLLDRERHGLRTDSW